MHRQTPAFPDQDPVDVHGLAAALQRLHRKLVDVDTALGRRIAESRMSSGSRPGGRRA